MIAARKLLLNTDLKDNKSEITNTKTKNKLNFMIDSYKKIKSKADETKWELNDSKNALINEHALEKEIIRETLKFMCLWIFEFESIFDDHSNV
jgi:hypothetical protein